MPQQTTHVEQLADALKAADYLVTRLHTVARHAAMIFAMPFSSTNAAALDRDLAQLAQRGPDEAQRAAALGIDGQAIADRITAEIAAARADWQPAPETSGRVLKCQMRADCPHPVTHIDNKGFIYCTDCGADRRPWRPCRKLRPHELNRLKRGETVARY